MRVTVVQYCRPQTYPSVTGLALLVGRTRLLCHDISCLHRKYRVRVFTGSGLFTGSDRIGPEIGLFLWLTDCFFFTRMMCINNYVFSAICMHLNILILI